MAACRDGENATFPFLATVRLLVAIVVSVLAVAVVVMVIVLVIIFVHRPVEMDFQSYGYVQTQEWWWSYNTTTNEVYGPAKEVQMLIIVDAINPSGRGQIQGIINIVSVMDIPNASSFTKMVEFCRYFPETNVSFDLQPHSSHRYRRWVSLLGRRPEAEPSLYYLYNRHSHDHDKWFGFPVMVVVDTTYKPANSKNNINKTYYCGPVTFLRSFANTPDGGEVACKTKEDLGFQVSSSPPPAVAGKW